MQPVSLPQHTPRASSNCKTHSSAPLHLPPPPVRWSHTSRGRSRCRAFSSRSQLTTPQPSSCNTLSHAATQAQKQLGTPQTLQRSSSYSFSPLKPEHAALSAGRNRAICQAKAGLLEQLSSLFKPAPRDPVKQARDKLLTLLLSRAADSTRVSELMLQLADAATPFQESLIGGGPWVVQYTQGTLQLWRATYQSGRLLNQSNQASQDINPVSRTVVNKVEYLGGKVYVTASGTYEPQGSARTTPQPINVTITAGNLHLFGLDIPLPIAGKGQFEVMYLDDCLRIFRSAGSYAVQVRADRLNRLQN